MQRTVVKPVSIEAPGDSRTLCGHSDQQWFMGMSVRHAWAWGRPGVMVAQTVVTLLRIELSRRMSTVAVQQRRRHAKEPVSPSAESKCCRDAGTRCDLKIGVCTTALAK